EGREGQGRGVEAVMTALPAPLEREWLWSALHALLERRGEDTFLDTPLLLPNDTFFPDRWTADEAGVRALAERLLDYAWLGQLEVSAEMLVNETGVNRVVLEGRGAKCSHAGAAAWFAGISAGICRFGADSEKLDDPLGLVAAMAHEVAHAFRRSHRLEHRDHD